MSSVPPIVMVTNAVVPDQLGGLQRYVRELAAALVAVGASVTVVSRRTSPELPALELGGDGVTLRRFEVPRRTHPLYAALYPLASLRAAAAASRSRGEIVHVHYPLQAAGAALAGARYVHTFHAPIYKELLAEHRDRYLLPAPLRPALVTVARGGERAVARRAAATLVLSRYMQGELAPLSARASRRATVIPGGIDAERFRPGIPVSHAVTERADPLLFTARRLVPRTGVSQLVQAMPEVLRALPEARLAIAGDGPLRSEIESLIAGLGLAGRVLMLGRVSDEELIGWYRAASLFVLPTQELEGFGISTIEALACGTPAVGTPAGATPEILSALDRRLLTASPSAADLARTITEVCRAPGLLAAVAARARAHIVPRMSWPAVAAAHLEVYERVAAGR